MKEPEPATLKDRLQTLISSNSHHNGNNVDASTIVSAEESSTGVSLESDGPTHAVRGGNAEEHDGELSSGRLSEASSNQSALQEVIHAHNSNKKISKLELVRVLLLLLEKKIVLLNCCLIQTLNSSLS